MIDVASVVGNPRAESRTHQLARILARELARNLPSSVTAESNLAKLGPKVLDPADPGAKQAVGEVLEHDVLVIATPPTRRRTPACSRRSLTGWAPAACGARPRSRCCSAVRPTTGSPSTCMSRRCCSSWAPASRRGLFVLESGIEEFGTFAADWAKASAAALTPRLAPSPAGDRFTRD